MAVTQTTQGPFFAGAGPISWSDLREQFRAANIDGTFDNDNNPISVSELYRITDLTNTDPNVPDCTENRVNPIPTTGTFPISRMRNSIKYWFITQTGNDSNLDLDNQTYNSNLNRNIRKRLRIEGTVSSTNTGAPAATFDAQATNVRIEVRENGRILGAGGAAGNRPNGVGGDAGDAITVNSTGGNNNIIDLNNTANVWGGGGGGDGGADGTRTDNSLRFYGGSSTSFVQCVPVGRGVRCFTVCRNDGGALSCASRAPAGTTGTPGCQGGYNPPGCACGSCIASVNTTVSTQGTNGVAGRGFNNQTNGLAATAPVNGGSATSGGDGGDWGQAGNGPGNVAGGGGAGGSSIGGGGANFTITGTQNGTTLRGATF